MPNLKAINIAFVTHSNPPNGPYPHVNPKIHVFVKNRSSDTSIGEQTSDFVSNLLAYQRYEAMEPAGVAHEINPYLGHAVALGAIPVQAYALLPSPLFAPAYNPPSAFNIPLRTRPAALEEIMLPVVNIHLHPSESYIEWFFSYTITFTFDDGSSYSDTTDQNGITGILLSTQNPNYSSICKELRPVPPRTVQETNPVFLNKVRIEFGTHDDGKDKDTQVNVHIVNRLNAGSSQDIAIGLNILPEELPTPATHLLSDRLDFPGDITIEFTGPSLASPAIALHNIVLPVVYIIVVPTGGDRWIFDYKVTYYFDNGQEFSSMTTGVMLDRYNHKHMGVYNGATFPTLPAPGRAPLTPSPQGRRSATLTRTIPWSFLGAKLDELVNKRQDPPLFKLRLDNTGDYKVGRESYFDLQSIEPDPPPPGTLSAPPYKEHVTYSSSPKSLGILQSNAYFDNINSKQITITVDTFNPLPVTARIEFQTPIRIPFHVVVDQSVDLTAFWIEISFNMTKVVDGKIDLLSWVHEINDLKWEPIGLGGFHYSGPFLGKQLDGIVTSQGEADVFREALIDSSGLKVHLEPDDTTPGIFQKAIRKKLFEKLGKPSVITHKTQADTITDSVNAWLLGGLVEGDNRCIVQSATYQDDNLVITYAGPSQSYVPPTPQGWPAGVDFTPGTLANIDHIVVLTKENRSFDTMLGYLSLPVASGGQGRTDVDGLKGNEFNLLNGKKCPSFPFEPEDTIFSPNTPNGPEHVQKAVNSGKMDGFVTSFADQDGPEIAPRIMGYHTAENVPVYDALARDFAISHRWFASHPGPSFCNRFYETTGRLNISSDGTWNIDDSGAPSVPALTKTIFDYLPVGVTWKYFEHGYCFLRYFANHTFDSQNIVSYEDPVSGFLALAKKGQLPNVSFIDPHYINLPPNANCDEPPSDVKEGQKLAQQIVEALVTSPQWEKTLLIITYDEHGGFFDHVPPPKAVKNTPDSLETYGCRVPTFIVSPWVKGGAVLGHDGVTIHQPGDGGNALASAAPISNVNLTPLYFDHTSILKTIARRFISPKPLINQNPPYLSARYAAAHDLSSVLGTQLRPNQFLPFIPYTLVYGHSGKGLEVQNGNLAQGALLWQADPNSGGAQQFRFEDAGDGYWYLRTFTGHLYLTADASLKVKQDVKYPPNGTVAAGNDPNSQRWKFTGSATVSRETPGLTVSNAAHKDKVLQPAGNSANSQTPVVLADPETVQAGLVIAKNPWLVSYHLSPANQ